LRKIKAMIPHKRILQFDPDQSCRTELTISSMLPSKRGRDVAGAVRYHAGMTQLPTLYDVFGGAARVRELVDRFYDLMELEPEFAGIRALHPPSMEGSRDKLFMFLSGWMGGPDLFVEQHGHPRLRARHLPFAIGSSERDQWLRAMAWAMEDIGIDEALRLRLMESFYQTADWMRNKAD
jgi:hemoglobin